MDDMKELIDFKTASLLVSMGAILGPILGLILGAALGTARKAVKAYTLRGLAIGALGILNWGLWHLFNAITDRMGLDTVRNLVANAIVFVILGALLGAALGRLRLFRF